MASIKLKYRPSSAIGSEGTIYYQVIHNRKVRRIYTNYHISDSEWDLKKECIKCPAYSNRWPYIRIIRGRIQWDINQLVSIIRHFEDNGIQYSGDEIISEFKIHSHEGSLFNYLNSIIARLRLNRKMRTAETYMAALSSFRKFRADEDIMLHEITYEDIDKYQAWLYHQSLTSNTVSFYMRILRATYNRAVDEGKIQDRKPFRYAYTGIDRTIKRAVPLSLISNIKSLNLSQNPALDYARDMFILSFMLRGMSFIDMAYLRKRDLSLGILTYRRRKTGQLLLIEWTDDMQRIVDKYPSNQSEFLLPIFYSADIASRHTYLNIASRINYGLKKVGKMAAVKGTLTLYVARHSWASAAKEKGIPVRVISECMGHDSETTTQIYLASLDTSAVNNANRLILSYLK